VNPLIKSYLGFALYAKGRYKDAIDEFVGIQHLSPSSAWGFGGLPFCYMAEGEFDKAEQAAEQCPTDWLRMVDVSMAQWSRGKHAESDAALQQLIGKFADVAAYQVAEAYGFRGDGDHAFQWLERAFRQHDPGLERLKFDGSFKGLYSDPRWDVFLRKLGLADDQVNFGSI
jgi:tetratricopeptide (TPR) repeat protein